MQDQGRSAALALHKGLVVQEQLLQTLLVPSQIAVAEENQHPRPRAAVPTHAATPMEKQMEEAAHGR
eukprot:9909544-Lingulodinium_polyedra.AAC.1